MDIILEDELKAVDELDTVTPVLPKSETKSRPPIKIFPPIVEFKSIQENTLYVMAFSVINTSHTVQRIRILPPNQTGCFTLNYTPCHSVAPGLEVNAEIEFVAKELKDYHDKLIILCNNEKFEVDLHALMPTPEINFDPYVDFGTVILGNTATKYIELVNYGHKAGKYSIEYDDALPVSIAPLTATIKPVSSRSKKVVGKLSERIKVDFKADSIGLFRTLATFTVGNLPPRTIDINANVVEQRLEIIYPNGGGLVDDVPFGNLYFGEQRVIDVTLVNNGPKECSYQINLIPELGFSELLNDASEVSLVKPSESDSMGLSNKVINHRNVRDMDVAMTVTPMEGQVAPYEQIPIQIVFKPKAPKKKKGFSNTAAAATTQSLTLSENSTELDKKKNSDIDYKMLALVECLDTKQQMTLSLTGKAVKPEVELSQRSFNFGECETNSRRDIVVTITNHSAAMPVSFKLNRVAFFNCQPSKGRLLPNQSTDLHLSFMPTHLGLFKQSMHVVLGDGIMILPLRMLGSCNSLGERRKIVGGPDALPTDFQPSYNYVDQANVRLLTSPSKKSKHRQAQREALTRRLNNQDEDEMEMQQHLFNGTNESAYTFSAEDLKRKREHREQYDKLLRDASEARKRLTDSGHRRYDQEGSVDIGIEPKGGLSEPDLPLPKESETLWLANSLDGANSLAGGDGRMAVPKKVRKAHDDNKLYKKKFKVKPSSQAEQRDCSIELSNANLNSVVPLVKEIRFGTVCVNSVTSKCFAICNELSTSVLVAIDFDEHEELNQSGPASQVVPPGQAAGFDVTFFTNVPPNSDGSRPFRRSVTYVINNHHKLKFVVSATVVPITLQLSHTSLHFRFHEDSLEDSCHEKLTLKNDGNAVAAYTWVCKDDEDSQSSFSVVPATGSIEPGKMVQSKVVFSPRLGVAKSASLLLSVEGGYDEIVHCQGYSDEPRCSFVDKKIDFGVVAVGLKREVTVLFKNLNANSSAVYRVESVPDGVMVTPAVGKLLGGEAVELLITLTAMQPKQYKFDSSLITIKLRGGKTMKLPIHADALAPKVEIVEEELDFDGVTVGSELRKAVSVRNSGDITGVLFVDWTAQPEFTIQLDREKPFSRNEASDLDSPRSSDAESQLDELDEDVANQLLVPMTQQRLMNLSRSGTPIVTEKRDNSATPAARSSSRASTRQSKDRDKAASATSISASRLDQEIAAEHSKFMLTVPANCTVHCFVVYKPTAETEHAFELPFTVAGDTALTTDSEALRRLVSAKGLRPRIKLSLTSIDFHNRVVARNRVKKVPYYIEFTLTNCEAQRLSWATSKDMLTTACGANVFDIKPLGGELESGDSCSIKVSFLPETATKYSAVMPLFLDGELDKAYLNVPLSANGVYPLLSFDREEILLPTVPLGVKSSCTFYVLNTGYDNLEMKTKVLCDLHKIPLTISYPEGKTIGIAKERIPVQVSFVSRKAMSFITSIQFIDTEGNKFPIRITGTTENSLLTAFNFVNVVKDSFTYYVSSDKTMGNAAKGKALVKPKKAAMDEDEDEETDKKRAAPLNIIKTVDSYVAKPPQFLSNQQVRQLNTSISISGNTDSRSSLISSSSSLPMADFELVKPDSNKQSNQVLLTWLNTCVLKTPLQRLPQDLIAQHGHPLFDLIETLSGRKLAFKATRLSSNLEEQRHQLLTQYKEFIVFLKSNGCLLHNIKEEMLLDKEDYVDVILQAELIALESSENSGHKSLTGSQLSKLKTSLEEAYPLVSSDAWLTVLYQVLKVYVLNRVTVKSFKTLPGLEALFPPAAKSTGVNRQAKSSKKPAKAISKAVSSKAAKGGKDDAVLQGLSGSNIYSTSEVLLLKWLSFHDKRGLMMTKNLSVDQASAITASCFGVKSPETSRSMACKASSARGIRQLSDFGLHLSDGTVLAHVLISHVPSLGASPTGTLCSLSQPSPGTTLSADQSKLNLVKVFEAMKELGLDYTVDPHYLLSANCSARDNLLLVLYLYRNLPQFIPKTTIDFRCTLGSTVTKSIDIKNPTKRSIKYNLLLEGSKDFRMQQDVVVIGIGGSESIPIEFLSRFSRQVEGRLMLRPDKLTYVSPSVMVFQLKSDVYGRKSINTLKYNTKCYELLNVECEVTNPFNKDCNFIITVTQEATSLNGHSVKSTSSHGNGNLTSRSKKADHEPVHGNPFFVKQSMLKLKAKQSTVLPVSVLPIMPGEYKAQIIFLDESCGEFLYELIATAELPKSTEKIDFRSEMKPSLQKLIHVPYKNAAVNKAKQQLLDWAKYRANRSKPSSPSNRRTELASPTVALKPDSELTKLSDELSEITFKVEFNSPFFTAPREFVLQNPACNKEDKESKASSSNDHCKIVDASDGSILNKLGFTFQPKSAGIYRTKLILSSAVEVRMYELEVMVTSPPVNSELDFIANAYQSIVQQIPLINNTSKDWALNATVTGACFSGPRMMYVGPNGATSSYPLQFKPNWIGEFRGELQLSNPTTDEVMTYTLKGVGEEPLADDHVVISCKARDKISHQFKVANMSSEEVCYSVTSDVPHVSGDSEIWVNANGSAIYNLTIHPLLGGTYTGQITFSQGEGKPFRWYTIELNVTSPQPEEKLEISTFVRKAVSVEITLANPLEVPVEFEVLLQGEGLIGNPTFVLAPLETASYELLYSPLLPGKQRGSISFVNNQVGEVWYQLLTTALPAAPVDLDEMSCAVGGSSTQIVSLENPIGQDVELSCTVSNRRNFAVGASNSRVVLPKYGKLDVAIEYIPSSLNTEEKAEIVFSSPVLGDWVFNASGRGHQPNLMPAVLVTTAIDQPNSSMFNFRNPFPSPLTVSVSLQSSGKDDVFQMLLKRPTLTIPPFSSFQIPFSFHPRKMEEYSALFKVVQDTKQRGTKKTSASNSLTWSFPLRGVTEAPPHEDVYEFRCKARERLNAEFAVPLIGLTKDGSDDEVLLHELVVNEEFKQLVGRALSVTPKDGEVLVNPGPEVPVVFHLDFEPMKPMVTTVELVVSRPSGGRWRFLIKLEAEQPAVDDEITIQALLNHTSSVSFKLTNQFPEEADFQAYFTTESNFELSVYPSQGVLQPYGQEGTQFIVSFTPSEYGKTCYGKLIIVTEEMQWSYEIYGTHPEYRKPAPDAKVSSHPNQTVLNALDKAQHGKMRGRNILRDNIKHSGHK